MPRYHFNVHDGVTLPDEQGHELPDLDAARGQAVTFAGELIRDMGPTFWHGQEWRMEVTDERGLTLFCLMFVGIAAAAGALS